MKAANEMFTKPAPAVKPGDLAVVVGAGVSGVAAAKLLHKLGARVRLLDRSLDRIPADFAEWAESAGVEIVCGEHSPSQFRDAKLVVPRARLRWRRCAGARPPVRLPVLLFP